MNYAPTITSATLRNPFLWGALGLLVAGFFLVRWLARSGKLTSMMGGTTWKPPVEAPVTSKYGMRKHPVTGVMKLHNGTDYGAHEGAMILAPAAGVVKDVYYNSAGGNQVLVKHDNGYTTGYAHLKVVLVDTGERVAQGEPIGQVGSTGQVTGPHLHFTMRDPGGNYIDPQTLIA